MRLPWDSRSCAAALAVLLLAAQPVWSQDSEPPAGGSEEEQYYRQSDPDNPVGPVRAPEDLWSHTFSLSTRFFRGMEGDAGLNHRELALALNLQYLWSPFSAAAPVRFEFGAELGWADLHEYESGSHTPQTVTEIARDLDPGFRTTPITPVNDVIAETEFFYGGPVMRLDFLGWRAFDLGISTSVWLAQFDTEAQWFCTDCSGVGSTPGNETVDGSTTSVVLRFGAFFSWQYDWFAIGVDAGFTYFQKNKLPMRFGLDFGVRVSVGF
jgi:hypothetical protein